MIKRRRKRFFLHLGCLPYFMLYTPNACNGGTFTFHIATKIKGREVIVICCFDWGGDNPGTGTTAKKCYFLYYCFLGTVCCHNEHKNMHNTMLTTIPLSGRSASPIDAVWMMVTNSDPIFYWISYCCWMPYVDSACNFSWGFWNLHKIIFVICMLD